MDGIQVVVRLVGIDAEGSPVMVEQALMVNPDGPASASYGPVPLPAGTYRIDVLTPAVPAPPAHVTAGEIVDEIARRLSGEDRW